uniref:Allorecognition 1 n=1 Tax=Hydractinia symbiolongicarpus TaxID=13093 RepID=D9ZHU4_HYDSY|nr:allorecognition 1 [Hydractinia symbiolongicarpus]
MGMDLFTFLCITLCMYRHVQSLNVKPVLPTINATFNATVELQWQVTLEPSEKIVSMTVRELPRFINIMAGTVNGLNVDKEGKALFGDRVSGIFNNRNKIVTLTLQNIQYNETLTFQLLVVSSKLVVKTANVSIEEISGSPRVCGRKLKSNYTVNEGDFRNITQDICGYPKPKVSWTLGQENAGSSTSFAVNNATRQYEYHYKTRPFNRSDCGSNIAFIAKNTLGSINGNAWIDVDFVPSGVSIVSIYNNNTNCINVTWNKQETGSCNIKYHLRLNGNATIYNTLDRHFTFCISMKFENVTVWASYKGKNGKMVSSSDVLTTPSTTTTTTTTTSTRKSKTTTNKSGGQVITNNGNGTNIGLIVGIVGGILFVIIIIIIVVCVLKHKKKNGTGNHSGYSMRVTGGENNYVIDPTRSNGRPPANPDDPEQAIYSELGPGGGRTGPRPAPEQSDYAEMKVDAMGYPIDGAKASEPPTYAPIIKPREGAKRRTPSPPRSNVDGARAAASTEPPTYAPVIKNRSSSRGRSSPPDEDDHEGVIV